MGACHPDSAWECTHPGAGRNGERGAFQVLLIHPDPTPPLPQPLAHVSHITGVEAEIQREGLDPSPGCTELGLKAVRCYFQCADWPNGIWALTSEPGS